MKLGLTKKIWLLVGILSITSLVISCYGIYNLNKSHKTIDYLVKNKGQKLIYAERLEKIFYALYANQNSVLLTKDAEEIKNFDKEIEKYNNRYKETFAEYYSIASSEGKRDLNEINETYLQWKTSFEKYHSSKNLKEAELILAVNQNTTYKAKFDKDLKSIIERNSENLNAEYIQNNYEIILAKQLFIGFSLSFILASIIFAFITIKDLKTTITNILSQLKNSSNILNKASYEIADSSNQLAEATNQQASSLQQTSSSLEEINAMVKINSDHATLSREKSDHGLRTAIDGKEILNEMISFMNELKKSKDELLKVAEENNKELNKTTATINQIADQTKVINEIVFQTKLLSFNASIEAARAGEQGNGFAVVAEEMNKLALKSGTASLEIEDKLKNGIQEVDRIMQNSKENLNASISKIQEDIEKASDLIKRCESIFDQVLANNEEFAAMSKELSYSCAEEEKGIDEINKAVAQLDIVTKINATASNQAAVNSQELKKQTAGLVLTIGELNKIVNGIDKSVSNKKAYENVGLENDNLEFAEAV